MPMIIYITLFFLDNFYIISYESTTNLPNSIPTTLTNTIPQIDFQTLSLSLFLSLDSSWRFAACNGRIVDKWIIFYFLDVSNRSGRVTSQLGQVRLTGKNGRIMCQPFHFLFQVKIFRFSQVPLGYRVGSNHVSFLRFEVFYIFI